MKKKILLFCSIFLLTGCTLEYNLTIKKDSVTESIDVIYENTDENKGIVENLKGIRQSAFFNMNTGVTHYYDITEDSNEEQLKLNYNYTYVDPVQLQNSNAIGQCYYNKSVVKTEETLSITTSDEVTCLYKDGEKEADSIVIHITTDLEVLEENADYHQGHTYTWEVNEENYKHRPIKMVFNLKEKKANQQMTKKQMKDTLIGLGIVGGIVLVVAIFLYRKHQKNNKFK